MFRCDTVGTFFISHGDIDGTVRIGALDCMHLALGDYDAQQQPTTPPAPPPAPPFAMPIKLDQAVAIANAAMAEAKKINVPMAIAISEPSGDLVYFARMENAPYSAIQNSQHKATTAARFRRPTRAFDDQLRAGNTFFLTFDISAAPGGLPIVQDGKLIGAIGVGGVSGAQDEQVARAGLASLK